MVICNSEVGRSVVGGGRCVVVARRRSHGASGRFPRYWRMSSILWVASVSPRFVGAVWLIGLFYAARRPVSVIVGVELVSPIVVA